MFTGARRRRVLGGDMIPMLILGFHLLLALVWSKQFLPVTYGLIAVNILVFMLSHTDRFQWPRVSEVCVSTGAAIFDGDWKRLVLASFSHSDEWHISNNMVTFLWEGVSLEKEMGSGYFCSLLAVFVLFTNLVYCALQYTATRMFHDYTYLYQCAAGFSDVIFAVEVVMVYRLLPGTFYVMGLLPVPSMLMVWAELLVISLLIPNASFAGHLAGILVGIAYVMNPLKMIIDSFNGLVRWLSGGRSTRHYTYAAQPTGYRVQQMEDSSEDELQEVEDNCTSEQMQDSSEDELQEVIIIPNPQHSRGPIGFEHLESEDRHPQDADTIGFEHLESETKNGNDIGLEHLNRDEASSNVRYRSHGSEIDNVN